MIQVLEFADKCLIITIINMLDDLVKKVHKTDGEIRAIKKKYQKEILKLKYSIQK